MEKLLVKRYTPALSSPLYVVGLLGPSKLGGVVARTLISRAEAKLFAELYNRHFPDHVIITEDGTCRLPRYEFHESSLSRPNLLTACGDYGIDLDDPDGGYDVLEELVLLGLGYRASCLVLIDTIQTDLDGSTYVAATKTNLCKGLRSRGAKVMRDTQLPGPAGIILGICRFHLLDAVGIFPALTQETGIEACTEATLKLVEDFFGLKYPPAKPS